MEFHIGILPKKSAEQSLALGRLADDLGLTGVWVADSHSIMRDAYALLSLLAVQTRHIKLASGVSPTGTRHPAVLANSLATLDEISGGRAVLGLGTGDSAVVNLGMRPERLAAFEEKVGVIRALLRGEAVKYGGATIRMPWSRCDVPIVMACSGPRALQLGGRIADGVLFQVGANPAFVRYALDNVRKGAESAGRRLQDVALYMRLACAVNEHHEKARDQVRGYASIAAGTVFKTIPRSYFDDALWEDVQRFKAGYDYLQHGSNESPQAGLITNRILDAVAVAGVPEVVLPRIRELAGMGLTGFVCPIGMDDPVPYVRTFAEDVAAKVVA
ncbi:MAG TPA: LLM class flavin-dependent oxidoreductase [Woeseiaceae bacterium]|nr:LLM class flavin-dependent oxidoreductase [Woeseiaceae bacterium]